MAVAFEIIEDPPADSQLWKTWKHLVDTEGWSSDDNSVTALTPSLTSTRSVFAVTPDDKEFVGTVIWNEYNNVAFLGFFLLAPEYRGKGCGMQIWRRAMDRIPKDHVLGLRGVPSMVDKYKAMSTPIGGAVLENYRLTVAEFHSTMEKQKCENYTSKLVSELTESEWAALLDYDMKITGRDRKVFLELYYKELDITTGLVFFDSSKNVIAHISCVPTLHPGDNVFKISPLYANSDVIAMSALKKISIVLHEKYPTAEIIFHVLNIGKGPLLQDFFRSLEISPSISGVTLYGADVPKFGDLTRVYIAHNNSCHYDY